MLYTQLVPWRFGLLTLHTISLCCYYQVKFEAIQVNVTSQIWPGVVWGKDTHDGRRRKSNV